jgi:ABC-type transport system involved in cytochrome bd biosynthesis fused ATPase/permease subunit
VIKLETAHVEEVRGIRKLDIDFGKETFAISGPNGSGKSGVIDAIEFGLTGEIGRLTGRGTNGLAKKRKTWREKHGPSKSPSHVPANGRSNIDTACHRFCDGEAMPSQGAGVLSSIANRHDQL